MKTKILLLWVLLQVIPLRLTLAADEKADVSLETRVLWDGKSSGIEFVAYNNTNSLLPVSPVGINASPITLVRPNGKEITIVAETMGSEPFPPLGAHTSFSKKFPVLDELNSDNCYESGLYRIYWGALVNDSGYKSNQVLFYREEQAPKISTDWNLPVDDPKVVTELLKENHFTDTQAKLRTRQIEASEGTKQYLFAHPFTIVLSVDGTPDLKLDLLATGTSVKPTSLPAFNSESNYLEVQTPIKGQILRIPVTDDDVKPTTLAGAETKKWIVNVSDFLTQHHVSQSGQYQASWVVQGKKVADFAFVRP